MVYGANHVVCIVKKAWRLGRRCNIVVRDWLEDCLPCEEKKKRARPEKGYMLDRVLKRVNQSYNAQQRYRKSFEDGVQAGRDMVENCTFSQYTYSDLKHSLIQTPGLHHYYVDSNVFEYKIVCTRINNAGCVNSEKYTIYVRSFLLSTSSLTNNTSYLNQMPNPAPIWPGQNSRPPVALPAAGSKNVTPKLFWDAFLDFQVFFQARTGIA